MKMHQGCAQSRYKPFQGEILGGPNALQQCMPPRTCRVGLLGAREECEKERAAVELRARSVARDDAHASPQLRSPTRLVGWI